MTASVEGKERGRRMQLDGRHLVHLELESGLALTLKFVFFFSVMITTWQIAPAPAHCLGDAQLENGSGVPGLARE